MGFRIAWIAVQGCSPAQAAEALARELVAGAAWDMPDDDCVAALPGGWTLVWLDRFVELDRARFEPLLRFGPAVACAMSETIMFFEARGYRDGAETWRITRDSGEDEDDRHSLVVDGHPPAGFEAIRQDLEARQKTDDGADFISEIPVEVAKAVCGFRHDEDPPAGVTYTPLSKPAKRPGLLARLFGAR